MEPLAPGAAAPPLPGVDTDRVGVLFFYKVTCPTCQMVAPVAARLHERLGERFVGIGQDPREKLDQFAEELGATFETFPDEMPFPISNAYGIRTVPTMFVLDGGRVVDVVESWDREGWNRVAATAGGLLGAAPDPISRDGDGLPPFRPG